MITAVIIISFTFFGTYGTFTSGEKADTVAFIAVDGSKVNRSELNCLMYLLASDSVDIQHRYAGNPFNDGFIAKDILETGLAEVIVAPYLPAMKNELATRLEKEKRFTPYANPNAGFLSAEQTWTYFAPDIKKWFDQLRLQSDASSQDAFTARVKLFLAERQFPATFLKQLIRYQEKEQEWLAPDQELAYRDLSLFGYHSVQDWFGKDFIELIAKYIINAAKIAESRGLKISNDEVLSSLVANVRASYNESKRDPYFKSASFNDYFQQQMRHLGLDQTRLIEAWKNVLLFRRFFLENQDSVLVSPLPFKDFYRHLYEYVDVELYALPKELRFRTMRDVHKFDLYVNAIRDPKELKAKGANPLHPPEKILSYIEVQKVFPELVQKQYRLRYGVVNKETLQTKVGVRGVWEWEVQDANWKTLQDKFPQLSAVKALSQDERFAVLDKMDSKTRAKIDDYSRSLIVDEHPEWLQEALQKVVLQEELLKIREEGGKFPFIGIKNRVEFMRALDKAEVSTPQPELQAYTQDGVHYYQITVLDKSASPEIVTFAEASTDGTLDKLLDKMLEATYQRIRSQKPAQFLQENGEWKPLTEVKDQVANSYYDDLIKLIDREALDQKKESPNFCDFENKEEARVSCRLLSHVKRMWRKVKDNPENASQVLASKKNGVSPLKDQWKLEKTKERVVRKDGNFPIDIVEAFSLDPGALSKPSFNNKSGISFFAVVDRAVLPFDEAVHDKVFEARALLGREVQRELGLLLLKEMQEKDAK